MLVGVASPGAAAEKPQILGWVEYALVSDGLVRFKAKLDTGAKSSSIHAEDVEVFKKGGRDWVRFTVHTRRDKTLRFERPVHRWVRIRRAGAKKVKRAVVLLDICLGTRYRRAQVNLTDRGGMNYALLIGRRFMGREIMVDSSRQFTTDPNCGDKARRSN